MATVDASELCPKDVVAPTVTKREALDARAAAVLESAKPPFAASATRSLPGPTK